MASVLSLSHMALGNEMALGRLTTAEPSQPNPMAAGGVLVGRAVGVRRLAAGQNVVTMALARGAHSPLRPSHCAGLGCLACCRRCAAPRRSAEVRRWWKASQRG